MFARLLLPIILLLPLAANAFPWMVKHGYGSCAACHVDPSGAGQLSQYGRAQAQNILRFRITKPKEEEEVPKSANFLWFLEMPEFLNLSGNIRSGALIRPSSMTAPVVPLIMAADLYATIGVDRFVFHGSGGFGIRNYFAPVIVAPVCNLSTSTTGQCGASFVSREHWVGAKFADDAVMVRAGRIFLPFGLRNNEHTMMVRSLTQTDVNAGSQLGVAVSYNSETLRGEIMGIAGNFAVGPDAYRERGYSAYAEYAFNPKAYLGISSLITYAQLGVSNLQPTTRHAHGLFARFAPTDTFAILAEANFLAWQSPDALDKIGFASMLQGDFELFQGLHLVGTFEAGHTGNKEQGPSIGGWLSVAWYALPHLEIRIDNVIKKNSAPGIDAPFGYSLVAQLHVFL
jgi:hypothetical protein